MDKKKKIIVAIVSVLSAGLLAVVIKLVIFPSDPAGSKSRLNILTPKVDEQKIDRKSKIENYQQEPPDAGNNGIISNLSDSLNREALPEPQEDPGITQSGNVQGRLQQLVSENTSERNLYEEEENINAELEKIMALQDQLIAQSNIPVTTADPDEVEALLNSYQQYAMGPAQGNINPGTSPKAEEISGEGTTRPRAVKNEIKTKNYFQGAGSAGSADEVMDLIPAETVDRAILVNGSTVAIRIKKPVRLRNPDLYIPSGSIVYGKVNLSADRLLIDIQTYRKGDKLYTLDFSLYDYDGREGVHLGNRTWPKIPSKIAKDVYDYAYQRGTQAGAFGGNSSIQLDEAKDIAILSAAKEIGDEVFEKRRVLMPKKYHLWFNINY